MDPTWPVRINSSNRIEMLSSNASGYLPQDGGDAIMTTVYAQRHVQILEEPFHSYMYINKLRACVEVYYSWRRPSLLSPHCSATVQRCIHNPSVLSERIQLWLRGVHKSASSVSRRAIDHGDDIPASVKSGSRARHSGRRAFRTDFVSREKVTYDPREMTTRSIRRIDDARIMMQSHDRR